ncbi:MAG: hypothetical protein K2P99_01870 [Burkholderiales bacterium]|nr:hypothetical protein [Burkholderiales bacterium]
MQILFVLVLMLFASLYSIMENDRVSATEQNTFKEVKADNVAGNIFLYGEQVYQYIQANYNILHLPSTNTAEKVEQVAVVTPQMLNQYAQKQVQPLINYKTVIFNYSGKNTIESNIIPTVYEITSWDTINGSTGKHDIAMSEVLGMLNIMWSSYLYQGAETNWVIPIIADQNNCGIHEIYSKVPRDNNGQMRVINVKDMFAKMCTQLQLNGITLGNYVYLVPVYKS